MKCIKRDVSNAILSLSDKFPLVFLTGPRQIGKSTVLKDISQRGFDFINLGETDSINYAINDPLGILNSYKKDKVIIDDIHNAPCLISQLNAKINIDKRKNYILSGYLDSCVKKIILKEFKGRAVKLSLLPLSLQELKNSDHFPKTINEWMFKGTFPEIISHKNHPKDFFLSYINAIFYRSIKSIRDMNKFKNFLTIVAFNSGNPVNFSRLGEELSIDARTANSWVSLLEEAYILFRLNPYPGNFGKRSFKAPKFYFYDTGFLCFLLGISNPDELNLHRMRDLIFNTAIVSEAVKKYCSAGFKPKLYYWRDLDNIDNEIELIEEKKRGLVLSKISNSHTVNMNKAKILLKINTVSSDKKILERQIIYKGSDKQSFESVHFRNWESLTEQLS